MDAEPSTSDLSEASSVSITLEATLEGHTDRAWCVAWEPQGRFLATCSSDRTARLWAPSRAAGGAWVTVAELEGVHNRTVRSVAWSPCGTSARRADPRETYLFPFSPSRSLRVPAALRRFFREERPFVFRKTKRPNDAFRVSRFARARAGDADFHNHKKLYAGRMLATASFDASTAVWAERGGDWECVAVVEGHENEVKSCAWSPSGALLATCGRDKTVWIWEVQPGFDFECVAVLHGHAQDVKQVRWHPTEDVLVSVSYDDEIRVWEEEPGGDDWSCARALSAKDGGHTSTVWSAAFEASTGVTGDRSDGPRMATCSDDRNIVVWAAKGAPRDRATLKRIVFGFFGFFVRATESERGARNPGAGQTVESGALQMRPGQHNCQRDRIVGLAAPAGKIATDASLTCGRLGSSPATSATSSRSRVRFSFSFLFLVTSFSRRSLTFSLLPRESPRNSRRAGLGARGDGHVRVRPRPPGAGPLLGSRGAPRGGRRRQQRAVLRRRRRERVAGSRRRGEGTRRRRELRRVAPDEAEPARVVRGRRLGEDLERRGRRGRG